MPVDMREWLPEDDLVFMVMVALLLYGYCQGERSSRVIEKRCVRDVGYRVITGGLHPDHAAVARFRSRHERALGGLFSQVLRLLAAEGMVSLGTISLDGTELAGDAAPEGEPDVAADRQTADQGGRGRRRGGCPLRRRGGRADAAGAGAGTPNGGSRSPPEDRLAAEDKARRDEQRARRRPGTRPRRTGKRRGGRARAMNRAPTGRHQPRANITDPDVRVIQNQKATWPGTTAALVTETGHRRRDAVQRPIDPPCCTRCQTLPRAAGRGGIRPAATCSPMPVYASQRPSPAPIRRLAAPRPLARDQPAAAALREGPGAGPVPGHHPGHPSGCDVPATRELQAASPHRGTGVRATEDLPETDHDVPPRPGRVRKRMAARLHAHNLGSCTGTASEG